MDRKPRKSERGQFIVGGIAFLAFLLIVVQSMVFWTRQEAKQDVHFGQSQQAFHAAEAGIGRAVWKLRERQETLEAALAGDTLAGYADDKVYGDLGSAAYRVRITAGPGDGRLTVIATGRDAAADEFRTIKAVLDDRVLAGPLTVPSLLFTGGANAIWGPILSTGNLHFKGASNQLYPRKRTATGPMSSRLQNE